MLILDVSTEKLANLKNIFNDNNIYYRVVKKSEDGLTTTLKFNNKDLFERAKLLVADKVSVQGNLIHSNPLGSVNIGDSHINWFGDIESPVASGGSINGDAVYASDNTGYMKENYVILTENDNPQLGSISWEKDYDYANKNIMVKATTFSGSGSGSDGITFFFGSTSNIHSADDANNALAVYADELDDDKLKIYINGVLQNEFFTNQTLDDGTYRSWIFILDSSDQTLSVYINNAFQLKSDISSWAPTGNYIGVSAVTVDSNNYHIISHYQVMSANPWLAINR